MQFYRSNLNAASEVAAMGAPPFVEVNWLETQQALLFSLSGLPGVIIKKMGPPVTNFTLSLRFGDEDVQLPDADQTLIKRWPSVMYEAFRLIESCGFVVFRMPTEGARAPSVLDMSLFRLRFSETVEQERRYWVVNSKAPLVALEALIFVRYHPTIEGNLTSPGAVCLDYSAAGKDLAQLQLDVAYKRANPLFAFELGKEYLQNMPPLGGPDQITKGDSSEATKKFFEVVVTQADKAQQLANELTDASTSAKHFLTAADHWAARRSGYGDDKPMATAGMLMKPVGATRMLVPPGHTIANAPQPEFNPTYDAQVQDTRNMICAHFGIAPNLLFPSARAHATDALITLREWNQLVDEHQKDMVVIIETMFNILYERTLKSYAAAITARGQQTADTFAENTVQQALAQLKRDKQRQQNGEPAAPLGTGGIDQPPPPPATTSRAATPEPEKARISRNADGELQFSVMSDSLLAAARLLSEDPDQIQLSIVSKFNVVISFVMLPAVNEETIAAMYAAYAIDGDGQAQFYAAATGISPERMLMGDDEREREAEKRQRLLILGTPPEPDENGQLPKITPAAPSSSTKRSTPTDRSREQTARKRAGNTMGRMTKK